MSVGENLRELRRRERLTQTELARLLGVTKETVCRWERDKSAMRSAHVRRLAELFGISADDILSEVVGLANRQRFLERGAQRAPRSAERPDGPMAPIPVYRITKSPAATSLKMISEVYAPPDVVERHKNAIFIQNIGKTLDRVYPDRCLLLIDPYIRPWNGCFVVAIVDEIGVVIRRYSAGSNAVLLSPYSHTQDIPDLMVDKRKFKLLGVVVWFQASHDVHRN